jgi:transposase
LEAKLGAPPKTPDNSSIPPSQGKKPNRDKTTSSGPRPGSLGRVGGGRVLAADPYERVTAKPTRCAHCQAVFGEADHVLHGRYDKVDLPSVTPVITRMERYAGHCRCCGGTTLAVLPEGLEWVSCYTPASCWRCSRPCREVVERHAEYRCPAGTPPHRLGQVDVTDLPQSAR